MACVLQIFIVRTWHTYILLYQFVNYISLLNVHSHPARDFKRDPNTLVNDQSSEHQALWGIIL